jgi:diguanylate cyclase
VQKEFLKNMKNSLVGLRARLLLLVLLAVIPAFGVIGYTAISRHSEAALAAETSAMNLARRAARGQARIISDTHELLTHIAQEPTVYNRNNAAECNHWLVEVHRGHSYYTNIGAAAPSGDSFCSSGPIRSKINIADRDYFQRAIQTAGFAIGNYQIQPATGAPEINAAFPAYDPNGQLQAVVYAALNFNWLESLVDSFDLPLGSVLTVIDSDGTVLGRYPSADMWIGQVVRDSPLFRSMLGRAGHGTAEVTGLDDIVRLYAFAPLMESFSGPVYVAVGIPTAVAFAQVNDNFTRSLLLMLGAATLALLVAWIGSNAFILRRVRALTTVAERLAKGDLAARTGLRHDTEEFGALARTFDHMAIALQRVNRALKTLSAGNRAVVRATDEPSLLAEMCRVIVEVGRYRVAWIGYAEHDEQKSVRVIVQSGFAGGHDAWCKRLGPITWSDNDANPVATAIRTGKTVVAYAEPENDDRPLVAALPLVVQNKPIGALCIYSIETNAFDAEEIELLDEAARDLGFGIAVLRSRKEHDRATATIERMADYDGLTGLPNHPYFESQLRQALIDAAGGERPLALFVLGVNRVREINDALGFHQGDLLLKEVGARLRATVPASALVARMRGDEFAVMLSAANVDEPAEVAQQALNALALPFTIGGLNLDIHVAIGISLFPDHGTEAAVLMRRADVAMQQAKRSGKSFGIYVAEQDGHSARRLTMAGELRRAIEQNELVLHYQPKIDLRASRMSGAEALVRWPHPTRGLIPPDEFIGLAESTGLIKPLTHWVVRAALHQSSLWRAGGLAVPIAVNLSARNLHDDEFIYELDQLFAEWRADSSWIEFEITEGAVMYDPESALQTLNRLSAMGITLSIDDFGTGYSSLGYLKKLPVDLVKIDKSFVIDMLTDSDSAAIVRSTISLAHDLDLKVVAEGVESEAVLQLLMVLGCDVAQGYYVSKPLPAEQFRDWVNQRGARGPSGRRAKLSQS